MFVLKSGQIKELLLAISDRIIENEAYFCELDSVVGDGDHGITMTRGFQAAMLSIQENDGSISEMFSTFGEQLIKNMGGAIGPIYGTLFDAFSAATQDKSEIDVALFSKMFEDGYDMVKIVADVKEGQKTMLDSLAPAVRALEESKKHGESLKNSVQNMALAAEQGAKNTCEMMAGKGRARFLKEKSIGYRDAGATSFSVMIRSMSDYISQQEEY